MRCLKFLCNILLLWLSKPVSQSIIKSDAQIISQSVNKQLVRYSVSQTGKFRTVWEQEASYMIFSATIYFRSLISSHSFISKLHDIDFNKIFEVLSIHQATF